MSIRFKGQKWPYVLSPILWAICFVIATVLYFILPLISVTTAGTTVELTYADLLNSGAQSGSVLSPYFGCLLVSLALFIYPFFDALHGEGQSKWKTWAAYAIPTTIIALVIGAVMIGVNLPNSWGSGMFACFFLMLVGPLLTVVFYFLSKYEKPATPQRDQAEK